MTRTFKYRDHAIGLALALAVGAAMVEMRSESANPLAQGAHSAQRSLKVMEVDAPNAKALIDAGALLIDVRSAEAFGNRHIVGALLVPLAQLRTAIPAALEGAKGKAIVIYCGDGAKSGPQATAILNDAGYAGAVNLRGGIESWQAAGMPIEKS